MKLDSIFDRNLRAKILLYLARARELSITQLVKATRCNHASVTRALDSLEGLVTTRHFGRVVIVKIADAPESRAWVRFVDLYDSLQAGNNEGGRDDAGAQPQ